MDDWRTLKNKIYFEDGSLRDIYVFGTDIHDWRKWADLVNEKYKVEFYDAKTELTKDKIDFGTIEECWTQKDREWINGPTGYNTAYASLPMTCSFLNLYFKYGLYVRMGRARIRQRCICKTLGPIGPPSWTDFRNLKNINDSTFRNNRFGCWSGTGHIYPPVLTDIFPCL